MIIGIDQSWSCTSVRTTHGGFQCKTKPEAHKSDMARLAFIARFFSGVIDPFMGDARKLAFIEGYSFGSKNNREKLGELGGLLKYFLHVNGWTIHVVQPTTLKKFVTGKGTGDKSQMQLEVFKQWGHNPVDDNDADAYALWQFGRWYDIHKCGGVLPKYRLECFSKVEVILPA